MRSSRSSVNNLGWIPLFARTPNARPDLNRVEPFYTLPRQNLRALRFRYLAPKATSFTVLRRNVSRQNPYSRNGILRDVSHSTSTVGPKQHHTRSVLAPILSTSMTLLSSRSRPSSVHSPGPARYLSIIRGFHTQAVSFTSYD
jgi:hypothetical protein